MSACELSIEFDRSDRVYRGGDLVRGKVIVAVDRDVECRALRLDRSWHTAGKGNVDHGPHAAATLFSGTWKAGQRTEYPFHFTAPAAPLSYRGQLMRIEHYVDARADVPWALDPKQREPFYVVGSGDGGPVETGPIPIDRDPERGFLDYLAGPTGYIVAGSAFVVGLILLPAALILWPAALAVVLFNVLHMFAAARLGPVHVALPILVHPGDTAPLRLSFSPTATVRYTRIEARLIGVERAVSGSGKQRRTHRHTIHEQVFRIADRGEMSAGTRAEFTGAVRVPQTAAYSIAATNNQILWRVVLRVQMPGWPAWKQTRVLRLLPSTADRVADGSDRTDRAADAMRPASETRTAPRASQPPQPPEPPPQPPRPKHEPLAEPEPVADAQYEPPAAPVIPDAPMFVPDPPADDAIAPPDATPVSDSADAPVSPFDVAPEPAAPPPASIPAAPADLAAALGRLACADRFNGERDRLLGELAAVPFPFAMRLSKVEWTISMNGSPEYRSGRTAVGSVVGSEPPDRPIAVRFPDSATPQIEALKRGDTLDVTARIVEWNSLYDRAECEAYVAE